MVNPAKTLETLPQFTAEIGKTAVKMENFREFMMKFYSTTQNKPLSEAQNSIFEKKLNQILPLLNNSPDHPPYAWMIQKAIEELAEKGESSEKLISDYIKKEHNDLPWAHDTLLNHHLKNLCASGEIVLTNNQTYVFPVLLSDKKPSKRPTKNKHVGKERDWDLLRKKKKKKQQKAVRKQYTVKKEDKDDLIAEKRPSFDPEGQDVLKEEVPEGQEDVLNEVRDLRIVEICSSDAQSNPKQQNAEAHLIATQRPSSDSEEQSLIEVHVMQDASLNQEVMKLNDIQILDSPPGFDHHVVLESTDLLENSQEFVVVVAPELSCDNELKQVQCRLPSEVMDDDTKNQRGGRMLLSSDGAAQTLDEYMQALEPITNITKFGLQQFECGEHRAMLTQTKNLKPTTDVKTCVPQSNPVHSSGADQVRHIVCKYEYRTPGKKAKEIQTKKQQLDKCDPLLEQRDGEPIINANEVRLLSGSAEGLQSEGTAGMQRRLRSGKALSEEGTGRMETNLQSWKNKSAKLLKPHVVEMHDDEDSIESCDLLNLEKSCQPDVETPLKSEYRGRGRPRTFKPESCGSGKLTTSTKKTAEEEVQHLEMESEEPKPDKKKGRGRPPKLKKRVVIQNKPEIRRGRGRPRKTIVQ